MSVQRRRRLTRTIVVAVLLVLGITAVAYAMTRDGSEPAPTASSPSTVPVTTGTTPPSSTPSTTTSSAPSATSSAPSATSSSPRPTSLAPVVTDSIPSPTASIGLEDPVPGTTNLQRAVAAAWTRLVSAAEKKDVNLVLLVGWRSEAWQEVLQRQARSDPTDERAGEWAQDPDDSPHVKGYAVDVTTRAAADWVKANGSALGWCQPYEREWWHLEYLATNSCPAVKPSITG